LTVIRESDTSNNNTNERTNERKSA